MKTSSITFPLRFFASLCIVGALLSACGEKELPDIDFPVIEMTSGEELCLPASSMSQQGLNISQDNLYQLLGRPNKSEDIDVTVDISPIFRRHLVEPAREAAARNEPLIVTQSTWNIGPCRLTVWLWPDEETGAVAFSSAQYHKDSLF